MAESKIDDSTELPPRVWPPPGMFQCPKEDCPRLFTSREEMEAHQVSYGNHAFCTQCNVQFTTHEELFLHQLVSKRHHNCPICNRSFLSDDGRDYHIQEAHPEDQGLACPGCRKTFKSGKSYQAHIISNACRSSAVVALNNHNDRRNRMKKVLREAAEAVPISKSSQNDFQPPFETNDNEPKAASQSFYSTRKKPKIPERAYSPWSQDSPDGADAVSSAASTAVSDARCVSNTENTSSSESPVFGSQPCGLPFSLYCLAISPDDLIAYEDDLDDGVWQSSSTISEPSDEDQNPHSLARSGHNYIREILPNWDSEKHWNSESKRYFCSCGFTNPFVKVFEQHVVMERTKNRRFCAHCGKRFNTIANLYRHIEGVHVKAASFAPKKRGNERAVRPSNYAERRLDMDGPMDIGEKEFQIYDRPPVFNENNQRSRSKNHFGLRTTKVPHGTYW